MGALVRAFPLFVFELDDWRLIGDRFEAALRALGVSAGPDESVAADAVRI